MFTDDAFNVFSTGHCAEMIDVIQELYENAFLYCAPGWSNDYNCLSSSSRYDITTLCRELKKVLSVAEKYGYKHFFSDGEILIDATDAQAVEVAFTEIFTMVSKEEACFYLEEMLATSLIDRLESLNEAPGKKEKDFYYCYRQIKELIVGYRFTNPQLKSQYETRYNKAA